jgi:hypothetical protein
MINCIKCNKEVSSLKGEYAAYSLWGLTPLWLFLLGPLSAIFFAGLGLYLYKVHNSKTYVCGNCLSKKCPDCGGELSSKKYCNNCKIILCPLCDSTQPHEQGTTWLKASILFPVGFAVVVGLFFINPWFVPLAYMLYVVISAPDCRCCSAKVYLSTI